MSTITLEAAVRTNLGKGASRRLRRLENKVPAIVYGGFKDPISIQLDNFKVLKALENESIYASVLNLHVNGLAEQVILKSLQRHPFKPLILHMDFQRVNDAEVIVRKVPIHFINDDKSPGFKDGGIIHHTMTAVEIRGLVHDLPEFISVDLSNMQLDDTLHLSDILLSAKLHFAVDPAVAGHDLPIASIHKPSVFIDPETTVGLVDAEEKNDMKTPD